MPDKKPSQDPVRKLVQDRFPGSRVVEGGVSRARPDASPLRPDRVTPSTRQLYEKFFGSSGSAGVETDAVPEATADEGAVSDREGGVVVERPAPAGRRAIKEQVLVSRGKVVALSDD
ncbi:MAG TPA: hypothetical protein VIV65_11645 [Gemmatimonadaceae bacterium]|jgi:hypothetical protein